MFVKQGNNYGNYYSKLSKTIRDWERQFTSTFSKKLPHQRKFACHKQNWWESLTSFVQEIDEAIEFAVAPISLSLCFSSLPAELCILLLHYCLFSFKSIISCLISPPCNFIYDLYHAHAALLAIISSLLTSSEAMFDFSIIMSSVIFDNSNW